MGFKEDVDDLTEVIISCWDSNQKLDKNGKPVDGLTFDERLEKRMKELDKNKQDLMDIILEGV